MTTRAWSVADYPYGTFVGIARSWPSSGAGYGINSNNSSTLGQEIDFIISYTPVPYLNIEANVSHYFHGDYIKQSLNNAGGSDDANYAYVQVTLNL